MSRKAAERRGLSPMNIILICGYSVYHHFTIGQRECKPQTTCFSKYNENALQGVVARGIEDKCIINENWIAHDSRNVCLLLSCRLIYFLLAKLH